MSEVRWINNLQGILHYLDTPILDFKIQDKKLVYANNLSDGKFFPPELKIYGITYGNINEFFMRRTMKEGCMFYREHLRNIGMHDFNFDEYIKKNNGNNHLDNYWIKFEGYGVKRFAEL